MAWAALYVYGVVQEFIDSKYQLKGARREERVKVWNNWKDPFISLGRVSFAGSFLLFLIGALQFRSRLK